MFNVQPGARQSLLRELFPKSHQHTCPACGDEWQCCSEDCAGLVEIYDDGCYTSLPDDVLQELNDEAEGRWDPDDKNDPGIPKWPD